ncbi:MAG: ABC transporter substrate-binding protein [Candidatus Thorarchaeota archaeon]
MLSSRKKRIFAVFLVAAFLFMAASPLFAKAQDDLGHTKTGPFVEKIVYDVISQEDQAVLALQDGSIDLIGDMVDPSFLQELDEAEDIQTESVLRNGYGYITINCAKYPFNITAFRRALNFAVDKQAISADVWDGLSEPQDSCVPKVNPFSVEEDLNYHYYEANVELGQQLLEDAGFVDDNDDNWLEAPNGEEFDVLIECAQSSPIAIEVGQYVADALVELGVEATSEPTDFYEYLNRLYFHGDYDMVFLGSSFSSFDVDWLAYEYWSEYVDEPYWNFPNFANDSYDAWREQLLYSTELEDVMEAAKEMQKIWVYQSPMIIAYENEEISAYRTDRFEGFVNDVSGGVPGYWTNYKVHLKDDEGGPYGGTFTWSNPLDLDTFNTMVSSSAYTNNILMMLYDSLITIDWNGEDLNWLCTDYEALTHDDDSDVPDGHTRFTFDMVQNATWTDGEPLTAEDVAFSLNYFRDAPGNPYGVDLTDVTAAYAKTPYTLEVEFSTESYWHLHNIAYKPVLPKHIFTEIGLEGWNTWNPDPPSDEMVTSGPFNVSEYQPGEFCEISRNPNYFFAPDYTVDENGGPLGPDYTLAVVAGAVGAAVVILVGGYVLMRQR